MDAGLIVAVVAVGGNILTGIGLVLTWKKNGRDSAEKYGALTNEVANVTKGVNNLTTASMSLEKKVSNFEITCAGTKSAFNERLDAHDKDIEHISNTMERSRKS